MNYYYWTIRDLLSRQIVLHGNTEFKLPEENSKSIFEEQSYIRSHGVIQIMREVKKNPFILNK